MRDELIFLSVAITTPFLAQIPKDALPCETAFKAYSICKSLPLGLKVVNEKSNDIFLIDFELSNISGVLTLPNDSKKIQGGATSIPSSTPSSSRKLRKRIHF